jgi:hypothetical protein
MGHAEHRGQALRRASALTTASSKKRNLLLELEVLAEVPGFWKFGNFFGNLNFLPVGQHLGGGSCVATFAVGVMKTSPS